MIMLSEVRVHANNCCEALSWGKVDNVGVRVARHHLLACLFGYILTSRAWPTGGRSSLASMREALGPPGGGSEGGPSIYMDAAKAASRQLQTLAPLIAAIGQAQLLQQRIEFELRSMSR